MPNLDLLYIPCGVLAIIALGTHIQFTGLLKAMDQEGKLYDANSSLTAFIFAPACFVYAPIISWPKTDCITRSSRKLWIARIFAFIFVWYGYAVFLAFTYLGFGICVYTLIGARKDRIQNFKNLLLIQGVAACSLCGILEAMAVSKYGMFEQVVSPIVNFLYSL